METNQNLLNDKLEIDPSIETVLSEAAKWARFLGIVGFVMTAIIVLMAIFANSLIVGGFGSGAYGATPSYLATMMTILYLIVAAIGFFGALFLYRFGQNTKQALLQQDQLSLLAGFTNLKSMFKLYGIIVVIYIAFVVIGLIFGVIGAIGGR